MRSLPLVATLGVAAATFVACTDDSPSASPNATTGLPDGGVADGSPSGDPDGAGAPDGAELPDGSASTPDSSPGGCSIAGDNYAIYGSQLFKVAPDLTNSVLVANVANQTGLPFASAGSATTGTQVGSTLVVSDANCRFCGIALPPTIVNGTVKAEPLWTIGFNAVKYFWAPGVPDHVIIWDGNGTSFTEWNLATKTETGTAGVLIGGPGLTCTSLYAINGTVSSTAYSVRWLAQCGDGSGPTFATLATSGGSKVGSNWQQDSFQTVASTKGMVTNPQITAADLDRGIYLGAANKTYKESGGTFVEDTTTVYKQCNAKTGVSVPGARPLISAPRG